MKANENEPVKYICPMHPDVVSDSPGNCPKCGMKLVPKRGNKMAGHSILMLLLCLFTGYSRAAVACLWSAI